MIVRAMQESDLEQVSVLEKNTFSTPWSKQDFKDALTKDCYRFYVAEEEGIILATAGLIQSFEEADITNVAVLPQKRRQGIAETLLNYAMEDGAEHGIFAYTLEVRESNLAAVKLYEKLGFVKEGIRKNFYENPTENAIIMWKR